MSAGQTLALEIPDDPSLLAAARVFAVAAARVAGCDDGATEDARLAVSEACTRAIRGGRGDARITVEASLGIAGMTLTVRGPAGPAAPDDLPDLDIVRTLFPDVDERIDADGMTLRFDVPGPP